jgi:hypothetical protein
MCAVVLSISSEMASEIMQNPVKRIAVASLTQIAVGIRTEG